MTREASVYLTTRVLSRTVRNYLIIKLKVFSRALVDFYHTMHISTRVEEIEHK